MELSQIIETFKRTDKSPQFYQYYPRLFKVYFPDVENDTINELCDAGYLYYQSALIMDSLFDDNILSVVPQILLLQEEVVKTLTDIYGKNAEFWNYLNRRKKEYFDAIRIEKDLNHQNATWEIYADLADKKSAFGKIAVDCMYLLSEKRHQSLYKTLLESHTYFSVGFQLYDDVIDFKDDIRQHQFNWAAYQLERIVDLTKYDLPTLNKLLYIKGVAQNTLKKSLSYFDKAGEILSLYSIDSEWLQTIKEMRKTITHNLDSINGYLKSVIKRVKLQSMTTSYPFFDYELFDDVIKNGLTFIENDFKCQYAELKHIMYLSRAMDDFDNTDEIHVSDTFQRAMLDNCLIDICKHNDVDCEIFINRELNYIIGRKNDDDVGGWSYFPTVNEIAADIDDLGEIMRLFIKSGRKELIDKFCFPAIDIALVNQNNKNGGIATWIIPNKGRTDKQKKQILFNETKWGCGPDIEVVANFAYALSLYNSEKYALNIQDAIQFVLNGQNENGYWLSRWYYGRYYGTYVCLELLKKYQSDDTAMCIDSAIDFLLCTQKSDGGYGMYENDESDMLSTAFALLGLKLFTNQQFPQIKKAKKFLLENQQKDGHWEMTDFIKPKIGESYKSKTLTTAIVLKALL